MRSTSSVASARHALRLAALGVLFAVGTGRAQQVVRPVAPLTGYWDARLVYDNNVFRYADDDLAAFRSGLEPLRYPLRSADDLDFVVSTGWRYRFRWSGRTANVLVRARLHQYVSNAEKSYGLAEAGLDRRVADRVTIGVSALWLPSYLIRYYRDPRSREAPHTGCRFSERLVTFRTAVRAGQFGFEPRYRIEWDDYVVPFDYYDTRAHRFGATVKFVPARFADLSAAYERKLATARGPDPDISYREHDIGISVGFRPGRAGLDFGAGYDLGLRDYTAQEGLAHAGRRDAVHEAGLEAGYRLGTVRMSLRYEMEWRNVSSPRGDVVEDAKRYRQARLVLGARMDPQAIGEQGVMR